MKRSTAIDPVRISYAFMAVLLVLVGWLHLATPLITALFCYFALRKLSFGWSRWAGLSLFIVTFILLIYGLIVFANRARESLPKIVDDTIPAVGRFLEQHGIELPVTDYQTLKVKAVEQLKQKAAGIGVFARGALVELAEFVIGVIVAVSLFISSKSTADPPLPGEDNLYSAVFREVSHRFRTFYASFSTVMGAQLIISCINAGLTTAFVLWNHFPHSTVVIGLTFLFGLLPILGNLMSNTLIVGVGFTLSPNMALASLAFLVVIHKLEYFLNSKIIGSRIQNPMWLTLLGLVLGEKLMGIPGMILAPVVLHYVKVEASRNRLIGPVTTPTIVPPAVAS